MIIFLRAREKEEDMASDVREQLPEGGEDGGETGDLTLLLKVKKRIKMKR